MEQSNAVRKYSADERLQRPVKFGPKPPSPESIEQIEKIVGVAVNSNLIGDRDAERIVKILKGNLVERIARLGQRISLVEETVEQITTLDNRLKTNAEYLRKEFDILEDVLVGSTKWQEPQPNANNQP